MKLVTILISLFTFNLFAASFVPQLTYTSLDTSLYIEDKTTGAGETFSGSSSSLIDFNLRYLMSPSWHVSLNYQTQNDEYIHPVATFSDSTIDTNKTGLKIHYFLWSWVEFVLGYYSVSDYTSEVSGGNQVIYTKESYSQMVFEVNGNITIRGPIILLAGYHYAPSVSVGDSTFFETDYYVKVAYRMSSFMVGLGYHNQGRVKETADFENLQVDSGVALDLTFSF
jgi:hypothetical protein